jgi:hypothetical protein
MNKLKNSHCYISGPIEQDVTTTNWRTEPTRILIERFKVNVFDPFADAKQIKTADIKKARQNKDMETLRQIGQGLVRKDLAEVDRADFIIARMAFEDVYYPSDFIKVSNSNPNAMFEFVKILPEKPRRRQIPTTGTIHEIINSDLYHKPTLIVCEEGKEFLPTWLIGFVPLRYLFSSWQECYDYLEEVNNGVHTQDDRWAYVYGLV